jgi:cysteine rich repeat protein
MQKIGFAALALVFGWSTAAMAQTLTAAERTACQADFDKYCKGTVPGGGRIIACLNKQRDQISEACKKVLDAQKQ